MQNKVTSVEFGDWLRIYANDKVIDLDNQWLSERAVAQPWEAIDWLTARGPDPVLWHSHAYGWNWDLGTEIPLWITDQDDCYRGTAIGIYLYILRCTTDDELSNAPSQDQSIVLKLHQIARDVRNNRYSSANIGYAPPSDHESRYFNVLAERGDEYYIGFRKDIRVCGQNNVSSKNYFFDEGAIVRTFDLWARNNVPDLYEKFSKWARSDKISDILERTAVIRHRNMSQSERTRLKHQQQKKWLSNALGKELYESIMSGQSQRN